MPLINTDFLASHVNTEVTSNQSVEVTQAVSEANKEAVLNMIDNLTAGDTILGKVLSQSGKNLSILTNNGVTINAKNSAQIVFEKGSNILFEVQKRSGNDLSIRPLYQNTSIQKTAEVALRQAGLPINERSLEMTGRNMEYGNPIDRQSLIESYKDVALYPNESVKSIIDLQKMDIPVTNDSLNQYKAYMSMENSVVAAFDTITGDLLTDMADKLKSMDPASLNGAIPGDVLNDLSKIAESLSGGGNPANVFFGEEEIASLINDAHEAGITLPSFEDNAEISRMNPAEAFKLLLNDISDPKAYISEEIKPADTGERPNDIFNLNQQNDRSLNPQVTNQTQAADLNPFASVAELMSKDSVKDAFKKVLGSQWSVESEKLSDKTEIRNLYDRLYNQTKNILDILNSNPEKNPAKDSINNLRQNLEFMNDLNNYVPYVQIPFHTENGYNNSELYVYTNKKNLAAKDGEVSAFIHLDMEHLGPTDVYVKMSDLHVSTNFTVKDEDTLIFLEHHLDFLEKRLEKKGYSFEANVSADKDKVSPIEQVLSANEQHLYLQDTSFDARV